AIIHFGIGKASAIDSVVVQWDHLQSSVIANPSLNEEILVDYETTRRMHLSDFDAIELVTDEKLIDFRHIENEIDEYKEQVLLPHKISQNGPFIEVFDANGDDLEDVFIGGAKGHPGSVFIQTVQGGFNKSEQPALIRDKNFEDMEASSFDFDDDGDLDLYVVSGGHEFASGNKGIVDRLYLNNGKGLFSANHSIELSRLESQAAAIIDLNNDQKNDFFIGGRGIPGSYPLPASSELYLSSGQEYLKTIFDSLGMVTDVVSADLDGDKDLDLILVGEWMPITLLINNADGFIKEEIDIDNKSSRSWWWRVEKGDFDNDGDIDFLLGNLGLNNKFKPSSKKPFQVFSDDFDSSGDQDVVLAKVIGDELFPVRGRECSSEEMPFISEKFQSFDAFAKATLNEILTDEKLDSSLHYMIYDFKSVYLENLGNLKFESHPLPYQVQLGPVKDFVVSDLNKDGKLDFIFAGNHYPVEVETVRYDGSKGGICLGDGQGNFEFQGPASTGLYINCDSRDMELIDIKGEKYLLVSCNDDHVKTLRLNDLR
ncbi:MAG: VCBS repeat-containing protein, partial [Bacteroidia bacterium]|nr:VCBS repeat-containing protein [Bacteroidia bacterium]